ncbi:MAG: hypothetical protein H7Z75_06535 [Ferruginibacter sp.]|nr:hypothetical protein [Cytophagales bacterium]
MKTNATKLTPLQLELLRVFSHNPSEGELRDIKRLLANYYAEKLQDEVDKAWDERGYNNDTVKEWLNTHMRISKDVAG